MDGLYLTVVFLFFVLTYGVLLATIHLGAKK